VNEFFRKFNDLKNRGDWQRTRDYINQELSNQDYANLMHILVDIEENSYEAARSKLQAFDIENIDDLMLEFGYNVAKMNLAWRTKQINDMIAPQQDNETLISRISEDQLYQFNSLLALFYNLSSKILAREGNLTLAENYIHEGIKFYEQSGDQYAVVKSLINLSVVEKDRGNYQKVNDELFSALEKLYQLDSTYSIYQQLEFMIKGNIASTYLKLKQFHDAISMYNEIDELVKARGNDAEYCIHLINKGSALSALAEYEGAEQYLNQSLELAEKINNSFLQSYIYRNLGELEFHKHQLTSALILLNKSLALAEELDLVIVKASDLSVIGFIQALQGQLAAASRNYEQVMKLINQDTEIFDPDFLDSAYQTFAIISARKGDTQTALKYWLKQLDVCQTINEPGGIANALFSLFQYHLEIGQEAKADQYLDKLNQVQSDASTKDNDGIVSLYNLAKALSRKESHTDIQDVIATLDRLVNTRKSSFNRVFGINHLIVAIYHLSEIYVTQLRMESDIQYLEKVTSLAEILSEIATSQHIVILQAETLILQSKLKILEFEMIEARTFLQEALDIAKQHDLEVLKAEIKTEIDEIISGKSFSKNHDLPQLVVDSKILLFIRTKGSSRGSYPQF